MNANQSFWFAVVMVGIGFLAGYNYQDAKLTECKQALNRPFR